MNPTLKLLRVVGSPFIFEKSLEPFSEEEASELYLHAVKNRISLLYLDALYKKNKLFALKSTYRKQYARYIKIFDTMVKVSDFLRSSNVEHAIFKSIKPFPDASVDIDTLIFDSEEYEKAIKIFPTMGYKMLGYGPQSVTFFDSHGEVGIDLYREIAVSWIIYLDKKNLERYIVHAKLPDDRYVNTLAPEADLTAIIAHSLIKEQMYTLAEFYTILGHLRKMNMDELKNLTALIKTNSLASVARSLISITLALHSQAFSFVPKKLAVLSEDLERDVLEERRLEQNAFETPHKYHFLMLAKSLMGKLWDQKTRKSLATQGYEMLRISFARNVFGQILDHITRETY
jgi:hypothetical protein